MKTILLFRHGKSSWKDASLADHDRPLKKRGKRDAVNMGEVLVMNDLIPDSILCSTAKRAKDTVKYLLESIPYDGEVTFARDLYHGYIDDFIELLKNGSHEIECVMVVGHNPGLEEFLATLTEIEQWLPTAAIAQVRLDISQWQELDEYSQGELVNLWRPRELTP
jgi:phosphohistidine phosphatase